MDDNVIINGPVRVYPAEQEFLETYVGGTRFPWFWQNSQTFNDPKFYNRYIPDWLRPYLKHYNGPFLSHTLLLRSESPDQWHIHRKSDEISVHWEFFLELFDRFMKDHGLKYTKIYRANLNLNWYNGSDHTEPHLDHEYPHFNFIMYLDTCDQGQTIVWPDDFTVSYMIPAVKYTAVTFRQQWHAHRYPPLGQKRTVFVVTYGVD